MFAYHDLQQVGVKWVIDGDGQQTLQLCKCSTRVAPVMQHIWEAVRAAPPAAAHTAG